MRSVKSLGLRTSLGMRTLRWMVEKKISHHARPTRIDENVPAPAPVRPRPCARAATGQHRRTLPGTFAYVTGHLPEATPFP